MKLIIEGGATRTTGVLFNGNGEKLESFNVGPTNLHVVGSEGVYRNLKNLLGKFKSKPTEYHLYLSGLKTNEDKIQIRGVCRKLGLRGKIILGHDLLAALLKESKDGTGIVVVSGTGSGVYGRNKAGKEIQVGGWGEKIGDEASAYSIAIAGLKSAIRSFDGRGEKTVLENKFGNIKKLTDRLRGKSKTDIAGLAPIVFREAEKGDFVAEKIIDDAVDELVKSVNIVIEKIGQQKIILAGGNFEHQPLFRAKILDRLNINRNLITISVKDLVRGMINEDKGVVDVVACAIPEIIKAINEVTYSLNSGGRLFYAGAGTSGRIAMMDAVECNPTFGIPHNMVQAIIAGGNKALTKSQEGAEDDYEDGRKNIQKKHITGKDVLIGITASGKTPFVLGAIAEAKKRGAFTVLITSGLKEKADLCIKLDTGDEIIKGSTRLKAGTAAKMVLNMISTVSMIKIGKTFNDLMIDVVPKNVKLIKRAGSIISKISGLKEKESLKLLKDSKYNARKAVVKHFSEKINQLLMFGFNKDEIPKEVGSIIVFDRNVKYLSKFKNKGFFIAIDQEGGRVNRIKEGVTILPSLSEVKNIKDSYKFGKILAKELMPLGISLDFAPVMDVNTEKKNPIIGDRSFGDNTKIVSELGVAMINGMQKNGLLACAKHFPGHGPTKKDSHKCLPEVNISYKQWENTHMPPFKSAIDAGVSCIMVGHILYPALDKKYPASLSYKVITEILRDKMGYSGVIVTDDILMKGITQNHTPEEAAILSINAGVDIVLVCKGKNIQKRVKKAILDAVMDGRIDINRINESYNRVKDLKKRKGVK
jgi:beta-N-acetylhexosaminidase